MIEHDVTPRVSPLAVRINEVMWMGTDKSTADEWVELTAVPALTGAVITQPESLVGWTIGIRKDTGESIIAEFGSGHMIQSGSYIVVSHYNMLQSRLKHEPIVAPSLTLPNTKLQIILRDPSGTVTDIVDDYIGAPFAGANPSGGGTKASMERVSPRLSGSSISSWRTATTARGWDTGIPIFGTPGYENGSTEPIDTTPPPDVRDLRMFSVGNTITGLWTADSSGDVERQMIDVLGEGGVTLGTHQLTASQSSWSGTYSGALMIRLQTSDGSGHFSTCSIISVQPLYKPIINEIMPDPLGSDTREWIELHNPYSINLDMRGWTLRSASKTYVMPHQSGSILKPDEYIVLDNLQTGLGLPNAGGEVSLSIGGMLVDEFMYQSMPDGVSASRSEEGIKPQCVPTPYSENIFRPITVAIDGLQTGESQSATLNLNASVLSGSLAGASCTWDFGDGFTSNSCNPPSHAMKIEGSSSITVEIKDYCGNTIIQSASIFVEGKTKSAAIKQEDRCKPSVFSGVLITEFLASPEAGEEWIELHNRNDLPVSLCGWSLDDREGGSDPFRLEEESIEADGYLTLTGDRTDIALNNDQDIVRLIGPFPGGGTGVLASIPYQSAEKDTSMSLRDDGEWLSTRYVTPGSSNLFVQSPLSLDPSIITIEAALPDPHGPDVGNEWIELRNMTHQPQWIDKWRLETGSGKNVELAKMVFEKNEVKKIRLPSSFSLKNAHGSIVLIDDKDSIQSVLAWEKAEQGHLIGRPHLPDAIEAHQISLVSPVEMSAIFDNHPTSLNVHLAGLSIPTSSEFIFINNENKNTISALIKNKKIELQSDSLIPVFYIKIDGVDVAPAMLEAGMVYITEDYDFARKNEYRIHEAIARKQKLGIWKNQKFAEAVDTERLARMMDAKVARDGLLIESDTSDGIVNSGAVIRYTTSVPADLFIAYGTGKFLPFAGGTMINGDRTIRVKASYKMAYKSQKSDFSTVAIHEYTVLKDSYEPCIQISEIYASPKTGENEWIEVVNNCGEEISLQGWTIDDAEDEGSKPVTLQRGLRLSPYQLSILSGGLLGGIAFNNGGDSVVIRTPRGSLSHAVDYPSLKKGRGYAYSTGGFCLTDELTPLGQNVCFIRSVTKKTSKPVEVVIGLRNLHKFFMISDLLKNTKIDQNFAYFEGLKLISVNTKLVIFWLIKYVLFSIIVFLVWKAWRWWKESVE